MEEQIQETEVVKEGLGSLTPEGGNAMTSIQNAANPGIPVGNIVEQQETARGLSEVQLIELAKSPDPSLIPPYLVTSELMRRKTVREKAQAKAPQFTVAQDAVNNAEQGIMSQLQKQAPKMPPGGFVSPMQQRAPQPQQRRPQMNPPGIMGQIQQRAPQRPGGVVNTQPQQQMTREQIMARGVPTLPNPGNRLGQGGMAQGGIIGFSPGGYTTTPGYYMPKVKGKGAIANLQYAPERESDNPMLPAINTSQGLYQDFPVGDYESYVDTITGLGKDKRDPSVIEDIQESFETPYDSEIIRLQESLESPVPRNSMDGGVPNRKNFFSGEGEYGEDGTPTDVVKLQENIDYIREKNPNYASGNIQGTEQDLQQSIADLKYQRELWFKGESDNLIKQRGMRNPESNQGFVYDETIKEQIVKPQGGGQGSGFNGLGAERRPTDADIASGRQAGINPPPGTMTMDEMLARGYNQFNPAGGPVEPPPNLTVKQYQKDLAEAKAAFGLEPTKDYYAAQRKLVGEEKAELLKDKQDYTNLNLVQTGFDIADTGSIFGGAKRGVEREILNTKDAKRLKKISEKEERAIRGMERAEISGDAKGYMKERKVQKEQQLAAIKLNMDAYGDFLKSKADQFGKRSKDWIAAVSEATKIHGSSQANVASRYAGNDAAFKRDIYVTATEIFGGKTPTYIDPGSANTATERGPGIYPNRKPLTSFKS
mgnify:CR=1 FL=1